MPIEGRFQVRRHSHKRVPAGSVSFASRFTFFRRSMNSRGKRKTIVELISLANLLTHTRSVNHLRG
jgi:hypothetical protein